jgi:hypothetical protein
MAFCILTLGTTFRNEIPHTQDDDTQHCNIRYDAQHNDTTAIMIKYFISMLAISIKTDNPHSSSNI